MRIEKKTMEKRIQMKKALPLRGRIRTRGLAAQRAHLKREPLITKGVGAENARGKIRRNVDEYLQHHQIRPQKRKGKSPGKRRKSIGAKEILHRPLRILNQVQQMKVSR